MKKAISVTLIFILIMGSISCLAVQPYEVVRKASENGKTGVWVKNTDTFKGEYTLYAAYADENSVYEVKRVDSSLLENETEISFNTVNGAEIKLFAWNEKLQPVNDYMAGLDYATVMGQLKKANDYWITKKANVAADSNPWEVAVFHTGNMQAYYMTGDELYRNYSMRWGNEHSWQSYGYPDRNQTNADNICCFRTYIDLYNIDSENVNLSYVKNQVDTITNSSWNGYWNWIDAFYMAAPIFTKMYELTGEEKYLDKMYNMIKYNAETLNCYDEEVGLWFRDANFINSKSENGEKVFWSRGDGWVYAAFAQIIEELPDSYKHKEYFVDIFLEMSKALKNAQCPDGAWHESLLDRNFNPDCEESGTGFFVYGMLWGINNGYLDENEYFPAAARGWKWLSEVALQENGSVGYVQAIGAQPTKNKLSATTTQHYAYANFVYAASEMAKYLGGMQGDVVPYLQKKLLGNIEVYKKGAPYMIKKGEILPCDIDTESITASEGMYLYKHNDIYVLSEFITPFNKTEEKLFDVLGEILEEGKFPERPYTDPDRIRIIGGEELEKPDGDKIELTIEDITVSQIPEPQNGPANMIDSNVSTRWAARVADKSDPCWAIFDLGEVYSLDKIGLSFNNGSSRQIEFEVLVSSDGEEYVSAIPRGSTSGTTNQIEYYPFKVNARFVKLVGYGNNASSEEGRLWFSPTEVEFYKSEE